MKTTAQTSRRIPIVTFRLLMALGFFSLPALAPPAPVHAAEQAEAAPPVAGEEAGAISGDVFGKKGGWIHFGLALNETYNDNIKNAATSEQSDFITTISPAIWIAMPGIKQDYGLSTGSMKPGGLFLRPDSPDEFRRIQTYLLYQGDFEFHNDYAEENDEGHKLEGIFRYNLKGGMGIGLIGQFLRAHDARGAGTATELDRYETGLGGLMVSYDLGRTAVQAGYSRFMVNYLEQGSGYRDRQDDAYNITVAFKYSPKTELFTEYRLIDIGYVDTASSRWDSREHQFAGGVSWRITDKSKGSLKAGFIKKDFESSNFEDDNEMMVGLQMDHRFTPKTSIALTAERLTQETNSNFYDFMVSDSLRAIYRQQFISRWTGSLGLNWDRNNYQGGGDRTDTIFAIRPALSVPFGRNFKGELAYAYEKRDSTVSVYEYQTSKYTAILSGTL